MSNTPMRCRRRSYPPRGGACRVAHLDVADRAACDPGDRLRSTSASREPRRSITSARSSRSSSSAATPATGRSSRRPGCGSTPAAVDPSRRRRRAGDRGRAGRGEPAHRPRHRGRREAADAAGGAAALGRAGRDPPRPGSTRGRSAPADESARGRPSPALGVPQAGAAPGPASRTTAVGRATRSTPFSPPSRSGAGSHRFPRPGPRCCSAASTST